jgi:hypothetical protein
VRRASAQQGRNPPLGGRIGNDISRYRDFLAAGHFFVSASGEAARQAMYGEGNSLSGAASRQAPVQTSGLSQ